MISNLIHFSATHKILPCLFNTCKIIFQVLWSTKVKSFHVFQLEVDSLFLFPTEGYDTRGKLLHLDG